MKEAAMNWNSEQLQSLEFLSQKCPFAAAEVGSSGRVWPQWGSTWLWALSLVLLRYLPGMLHSWNQKWLQLWQLQTWVRYQHLTNSVTLDLYKLQMSKGGKELGLMPDMSDLAGCAYYLCLQTNTSLTHVTHIFGAPYVRHWWLVFLHLFLIPFAQLSPAIFVARSGKLPNYRY